MSDNKETTTVQQVDMNLDELLGMPGADNIMIPTENKKEEEKPSIFSRKEVDLSFLDKAEEDDENETKSDDKADQTETSAKKIDSPKSKEELDNLLDIKDDTEDQETSKKGGRPTGLVELGQKLIEKGYLTPFEGDEDVSKYTLKDWEELFEANEKEKAKKYEENISTQFFESLPEELQYAASYVANGGNDLKSLFRSLAAVEEIRELDVDDESGQEQIVRSYLHATSFGTSDEIEEEIESWKDRDELKSKAKKFKPKLDAMQEQIVARQLEQQEQLRKQQQRQAQLYTDNIYKTLEPGELNGLKVDKKMQNLLFSGLTQANYPSVSGRQTNLLGHLLEKYQYVEPNHSLISEALWLLADPEGYRNKVREIGKKEAVEKTVRQLKTEQSNKISSTSPSEDYNDGRSKKPGIQRPSSNFFKR